MPRNQIDTGNPARTTARAIPAWLIVLLLLLATAIGTPGDLRADTTLVATSAAVVHTFKVKDGRVLVEQSGEQAAAQSILYDRRQREITLLDHDKKTFLVIAAEKLENLGKQVDTVLGEVDKRLSLLEDEKQQEALRGLLRGVLNELESETGNRSRKQYTLRDKTSRIAQWECSVLDRKGKGKREASFYLVDRETLGVSKADHETLASLEAFTNDLVAALPGGESIRQAIGPPNIHFPEDKIPVRTITYGQEGKLTSQITKVANEDLDEVEFSIPAGYTEQTIGLPF